jgi:magnesium transporter
VEQVAQFQLTKEYLQSLEEAILAKDAAFITHSLEEAKAADVSDVLEEFDAEDSKYILDLLDDQLSADVIVGLEKDTRIRFLKLYTPEELARYLNYVDSDDAVDILHEVPLKFREESIPHIADKEKLRHIIDLLRYDEDCAGGLMAKEFIKANINWNITQTIEEIRRQAEKVTKIFSVYVVDDNNVLLGRVSLKEIILANESLKIESIYESDIESVPTYMEKEEVAALMSKYDLEAVPVVNVQGQLLGRITIDDIVDVITEQAEEDMQLMAGLAQDVEEDDGIWSQTKARIPWLIIGLGGGLLGARFLGLFEAELQQITAIAFFIPLIMATGGNVGIQSSTIVVQNLAAPSAFEDHLTKKLSKVLVVAIINGILLSAIVFLFVYLLNANDLALASVVSVALFSVVLIASMLGTIIPLLLDRLGINPALASGPFITTANDLVGLGVYFAVVHILYSFTAL